MINYIRKLHLVSLLIAPIYLVGQSFDFQEKIVSEHRQEGGYFGRDVAIHNDIAVVGSFNDNYDENGGNFLESAGAVYVYQNISGKWTFSQKIVPSIRYENDFFGHSVEIYDDVILVGAYKNSYDENGDNPMMRAGVVYVFNKSNDGIWEQNQILTSSDRDNWDDFGYDLSIFKDYCVIGSPGDDFDISTQTTDLSGSAYVFKKNNEGIWVEVSKLRSEDIYLEHRFGLSVDIYEDFILIGANKDTDDENNENWIRFSGSAYVFKNLGDDIWVQDQKIVAPDRNTEDYFGYSVSINSEYIFIGAYAEDEDENGGNTLDNTGSVYIYKRDDSERWSFTQKIVAPDRELTKLFGFFMETNDNYLLVSTTFEEDIVDNPNYISGGSSVYVYKINNEGLWTFDQRLISPDREKDDKFGWALSIDENDNILIGAFNEDHNVEGSDFISQAGSAYFYSKNLNTSNIDIDDYRNTIVYPNPFNNEINITYSEDYEISKVSLFSLNLAKEVFNLNSMSKNIEITNLQSLPSGVYLLKIEYSDYNVDYNKLVKI